MNEVSVSKGAMNVVFPIDVVPPYHRGVYDEIVRRQNEENFLNHPGRMIKMSSEKYFYNNLRGSNCSFEEQDVTVTGSNTATLFTGNCHYKEEMSPITATFELPDGSVIEETLDDLIVEIRTNGLVLKMDGAVGSNFLGESYDCYLSKITSRNYKWGGIGNARIFDSWKDLAKFVKKWKDLLGYVVSAKNIRFIPEEIGNVAEDDRNHGKVNEILAEINSEEIDTEDPGEVPASATADDINREVLYRMKKENLWDEVVAGWQNEKKIYLSDCHIIYGLNEEAEKAVEAVRKFGMTPYHVVLNHLQDYDTYDVQYVSNDPELWKDERLSGDGWFMGYSWMTPFQTGEFGMIRVVSSSGGLRRIG